MKLLTLPLLVVLPFCFSCSMPPSERAALIRDITGVVGNVGPMVGSLLVQAGKLDAETNSLVSEALVTVKGVGESVAELVAKKGEASPEELAAWRAVVESLEEAGEVGAGGITGQGTTADILTAVLLALGAGAGGKVLGHKSEAKRKTV